MRARRKKHADERLAACAAYLCEDAAAHRGSLRALFCARGTALSPDCPLVLEIGCGKGDFAVQFCEKHPDCAFLAMERVRDVLVLAAEKAKEKAVPNLLFLCEDAAFLPEFIAPGELSALYLNFSDPWPKARHAKRRLTAPPFLAHYRSLLAPGAKLFLKTDNRALFDYSLETLPAAGFTVANVSFDLHKSDYARDNLMTEYERAFTARGVPICRLEATR